MLASNGAPLHGIRVLEFTHMLMGPAVGAILADMGADVIRIEPIGGDKTRADHFWVGRVRSNPDRPTRGQKLYTFEHPF